MSGPFVLFSGVLSKDPEAKISKAGKTYVSASLKISNGNSIDFWRVTVFSGSAQNELLQLTEGDSLTVQGSLQIELYESRGETKISRGVIADQILPLKQPPKKREPKPGNSKQESPNAAPAFDDDIGF